MRGALRRELTVYDILQKIKGEEKFFFFLFYKRGGFTACSQSSTLVRGCDDQPAPDPARCFDCPAVPAPAEQ
jgi:hypothetical protein